MEDIKAKIEAILYCLPQGISLRKISQAIGISSVDQVKSAIDDLQGEYTQRNSGLQIVQEKGLWMFKVPINFTDLIKDAADPEMDFAVLETLAYIAWRKGSRQCDVVRVRSNKAYKHIKYLKEKEFIESSKAGLSKWLQPTKKFYDYFQLEEGDELNLPKTADSQLVSAAGQSELKLDVSENSNQSEQETDQDKEVDEVEENVEETSDSASNSQDEEVEE